MTASNFQHLNALDTVAMTAKVEDSKQSHEEDCSSDEDFSVNCRDGVGVYDVVCGRQKEAFRNVGNRRFRVTVSLCMDKYASAPTRQCKSKVISAVAEQVKVNGGRFLKWSNGEWVELDDKQAKEKVGHALRDMASARETVASRKNLKRSLPRESPFVRNPNFFRPLTCRSTPDDSPTCSSNETRSLDATSHSQSTEVVKQSKGDHDVSVIDSEAVLAGMRRLSHGEPVDSVDDPIDWENLLQACEGEEN